MKQRFFISFGIKFQGHVADFAIISLENLMKGNTSMSLLIFKASRVVEWEITDNLPWLPVQPQHNQESFKPLVSSF